MHCVALTKRIRNHNSGSKITANSCHPGAVDSTLIRAEWYQKYIRRIFAPIIWFVLVIFNKINFELKFLIFQKTDQDGAQTPLYLALSKTVAGVSGKYFRFILFLNKKNHFKKYILVNVKNQKCIDWRTMNSHAKYSITTAWNNAGWTIQTQMNEYTTKYEWRNILKTQQNQLQFDFILK